MDDGLAHARALIDAGDGHDWSFDGMEWASAMRDNG
jgi:hypothetical protein